MHVFLLASGDKNRHKPYSLAVCLRLLFRYLAGDDPLTPRRCEPVPAVAWSLDREQPRRRSSSGMAGDDPLTPRRCEPVPAVAWSIDPKRPRRRSSQAWPAMIRTTFPRVSKMGLSGLFFDVLPPFLSPFSYNSLIYLSKLYFFTKLFTCFRPYFVRPSAGSSVRAFARRRRRAFFSFSSFVDVPIVSPPFVEIRAVFSVFWGCFVASLPNDPEFRRSNS